MRTRRLIKIPLGGYILCALIVLNVYQFNENQRLAQESSKNDEKNVTKILFYTAVRDFGIHRGRHYKMFRRQFRNLYESKTNSSNYYAEIFLDNFGYPGNLVEWDDEFTDTIYTSNIPESFAVEATRNVGNHSLHVFMSNHQFDITKELIEKLKNLQLENDEIACLFKKNDAMLPKPLNSSIINQCQGDFFAVNTKTALKIQDQLVVQKRIPHKTGEPLEQLYEYTQKLIKSDYDAHLLQNDTELRRGSNYWQKHFNSFTSLLSCSLTTKFKFSDHSYLWEDIIKYEDDFALKTPFIHDFDTQIHDLPEKYKRNETQDHIRYIRRPRTACSKGKLVSFVKCARGDFFEREWIRDYYQKMAKKADFQYNIFFLLGTGDTLNDEINLEARKYDDLIIGDFVDTYENLPLKTFLGFQFFAGFCYGNKKIINFHDSDAFVLLPDVIKDYQLNQDISDADYKQPWQPKAFLTDDSVYCIKGSKIKVQYKRDEIYPGGLAATYTNKWYNWIKDWPPEYHIPEYCNGNCNSMGPEAAIRIWREAQRTNRYTMRIEDKFFTGILRFKAGIPDEKVFPVTEMQKIVPSILNLNGLTRCLHVSQAEMVEKRENLLDTKMMNSSSIMTMITDWYINGDWLQRRPGFAYNGKDHLLARP